LSKNDEKKMLEIELMEIRSIIFDVERSLKKIQNRVDELAHRIAESYERELAIVPSKKVNKKEDAKKLLIGELPTVLLSTEFFPSNKHLIEFANKSLNLPISLSRKRSRREIIGIIITEVEKLDLRKIEAFRKTLGIVLEKKPKSSTDFFDFWEKTIRSMPIG
jgi:hypothetical protein